MATFVLVHGAWFGGSEGASCFFDVRPCLIQGEWKMVERYNNISCQIELFIGSILKELCSSKQKLCTFDEPHRFNFNRCCERTNGIGTCRKQNASFVATWGKIVLYEGNIVGVIKDHQPALLASFQPVFDAFMSLR